MGSGNSKPSEGKLDRMRGEIEDWVETLDNDIDDSGMQVIALEVLTKKMKRGKYYAAEFMAKANGVARVADSMKTWPSDEIIIRAACSLLIYCHQYEILSEHARIAGIRECLHDSLQRHQVDAFIPVDANQALRRLYDTGTIVGLKAISGAVGTGDYVTIVQIIKNHHLKNKVQEEGFAALARIFDAHPEWCEHLGAEIDPKLDIVKDALDNFPREERVNIFVFQGVTQMGKNPRCLALMSKGGVPALVLAAMREFGGWNEREYEKALQAELIAKQQEKLRAKQGKKKKRKHGKKAEEEKKEIIKRRLFELNLPLCQHAIYSLGVLLENQKAEWYLLENNYLRMITFLIDKFHTASETLILPMAVKRRYHAHQLRQQEKKRLAKMGIAMEKTAGEAEAWKDRVRRRREEFKPCLFAQTLGRGQCRMHCIECYAVEGVCDAHIASE